MLDLDASVDDYLKTSLFCNGFGFFIDDANLKPQHLRPNRNRALCSSGRGFRLLKNINDLYADVFRYVLKRGLARFPQDFFVVGIHGNNSIPMILHVLCGEETRAPPICREPHYRDDFSLDQDAPNGFDIS